MMELIDKNNMAVCALQQGKSEKALHLLSTALTILKEQYARRATTTETPCLRRQPLCCVHEEGEESAIEIEPDCSADDHDDEWSLCVDMEEDDQTVPSVFSVARGDIYSNSDGLVLNYNKALMVLQNLTDLDVLTSIVLYNMGIVNHGQAIERGSSSLLTTALKFYKMATNVIQGKQEIDKAGDFVLLVSFHNMAHIHSSRFCPEEMRGCFDATRLLLTQDSTHLFLDEDDLSFFSMSSLLEVKDIRSAPAA
jgi:hypothetical protein